ncbi:unnamed protein product [Amaranthus hypochondriacus]
MMKYCKKVLKGWGPIMGMLMVQLITTGLQILSKVILTQGTFIFALMTYRHLLAALCILPFALYFERITMGMGMFYYGLRDTSATYATNFLNLIPIVTFLFSIILRIEKLKLKTTKGKVKVAGAMLCLGGAVIISVYKGTLLSDGLHHNHHPAHHPTLTIVKKVIPDYTHGSILLVASLFSYATWFILQVKLIKAFPLKYWATMLTCFSAAIQSAVVGLCLDRKMTSWKLGWNLELVTIFYSGVLASALSFCLISWAISRKGPTFPAMFNPLALIFIAIIEVLLLREELRSGSLLGMLVIILGLYLFLWGGSKEKITASILPKSYVNEEKSSKISDQTVVVQSTATVVPTASPVSHGSDHHDRV